MDGALVGGLFVVSPTWEALGCLKVFMNIHGIGLQITNKIPGGYGTEPIWPYPKRF